RFYNDPGARRLIVQANPEVKNPDFIPVGMKLLIPERQAVQRPAGPHPATTQPAGGHAAVVTPPKRKPVETPPKGTITAAYKVRPNDSLIGIAQRFYGEKRRWKEIYELNKSVVGSDPEMVREGIVLKMPAAKSPASQPKK